VIDVPTDTEYGPIKKRLSELQQHVIIDYAESCLSGQTPKMNGFLKNSRVISQNK